MSQKRIPGRRARPLRSPAERSTASKLYRPKRVRAGSASSKARKKQAEVRAQASVPAAPPPLAPDLSEKQRRHLRGLAHALKPIIWLGNAGLTDAVATETSRALHDHELIKVKAQGGDREARDALFADLAQRTASALVHRIGNVAVLYRPNTTLPRILLPEPA
ncbi:MAG TPA: ribosome assembly RNA-binding protein YhbY [Chloroflexota bacterium]